MISLLSRDIAYLSLLKCEKQKSYTNIEVDSAIEKYGLVGSDRAFYTALVYGVYERKITLDYIISMCSSREISKIDIEILVILRMGIYQILYMDSIPDHAACNECVELCKRNKIKSASSFVNALLREVLRKRGSITFPDKNKSPVRYLSVCYSFPEWLCEMWISDYGFQNCESLLTSLNVSPDITLRVNTLKTDKETIVKGLGEQGIKAKYGDYAQNAVNLMQSVPVSNLDILNNGDVFVQDEASQLCAEVLCAEGGELVIDTCACPGGKSFSIGLNMGNVGKIYSFDLHASKLSLIKRGAGKLGIDIIETKEHDGSIPFEALIGMADRVLVDAPCSGLGVIAKKPDLRYKEKSSIERLPEIQYNILSSSAEYLKVGGVLVYSTCTLNRRENECVVKRFLSEHRNYKVLDFDFSNGLKSKKGMLTLYPDIHHTDGFFISRIIKTHSD